MTRFALGLMLAPLALGACAPVAETAACGSDEAKSVIDELFKEELQYAIQNELDKQKELGSYDATELDNAVERLRVSLADVRTSQDDPNSNRFSCRATIQLDIPNEVERKANESLAMAELDNVKALGNRYKMTREGGQFTTDFDYFIQPTDDGSKLLAEMDDDSAVLSFMSEVLAFYLLSDEIREEKIAEDQAEAEEKAKIREEERKKKAMEDEIESAFQQEADAALNAAQIERKLASDRISAVWLAMPQAAQDSLEVRHSAWVQQMKARCATQSAGTDKREEMREARELQCQTKEVRTCANTLERNLSLSRNFYYCTYRN